MDPSSQLEVRHPQGERSIVVQPDQTQRALTDLLRQAGLPLNTRCGQRGDCDGCCVELLSGTLATLPLREAREAFEREYLLTQINRFGGNISRTASFVGMERSALHRKLKSLGVVTSAKGGARVAQVEEAVEGAD